MTNLLACFSLLFVQSTQFRILKNLRKCKHSRLPLNWCCSCPHSHFSAVLSFSFSLREPEGVVAHMLSAGSFCALLWTPAVKECIKTTLTIHQFELQRSPPSTNQDVLLRTGQTNFFFLFLTHPYPSSPRSSSTRVFSNRNTSSSAHISLVYVLPNNISVHNIEFNGISLNYQQGWMCTVFSAE